MPICPHCKQEFTESLETMTDEEKARLKSAKTNYKKMKKNLPGYLFATIAGAVCAIVIFIFPVGTADNFLIGIFLTTAIFCFMTWSAGRASLKRIEASYDKIGLLHYLKE